MAETIPEKKGVARLLITFIFDLVIFIFEIITFVFWDVMLGVVPKLKRSQTQPEKIDWRATWKELDLLNTKYMIPAVGAALYCTRHDPLILKLLTVGSAVVFNRFYLIYFVLRHVIGGDPCYAMNINTQQLRL
jgi:hypothetical protein